MTIKYLKLILLNFYLVLSGLYSYGTIRAVPGSYSTIQSALNACQAGDTVLVSPGIYYEHIDWPNTPAIKLVSSGAASNTVIDGGGTGVPLQFYHSTGDLVGLNTIINGFTVRNGRGGGIFIYRCSPTFKNLVVTKNHSSFGGGGVYLKYSYAVFENSNFTDNVAAVCGGGIFCEDSSPVFDSVLIENNAIYSDSWLYGSGIYCSNTNCSLINSKVLSNKSGDNGKWYYGGGVYITGGTSDLANVSIENNTMGANGSWYGGGGISLSDCNANLTNVKIHGNVLGNNGTWYFSAGVYIRGSNVNFNNVLIDSNVSGAGGVWYFGLGMYLEATASWYPRNYVNLLHTTISNNINLSTNPIDGKSIYCRDCDSISLNIKNSILYNNSGGEELYTTGPVDVSFSDMMGSQVYPGPGNINNNPNFISNNDFRLAANSPCLGSGAIVTYPFFDLVNSPRPYPIGTNPDMGCYENRPGLQYMNISHAICEGDTFMNHSSAGIYIDTIFAQAGNDTIRTLNLLVLHKGIANIHQSICTGETFLGYTTSGAYTDTLESTNGCDSIRILNLSVLDTCNATTPVKWLNIDATIQRDKATIRWQVSMEYNNKEFVVEKSLNGIDWLPFVSTKSLGNTDQVRSYVEYDNHPYHGINFYRIKQINFDGSFTYSEVRMVKFENRGVKLIIYPNPSNEFFNYSLHNVIQTGNYTITIFDAVGKQIKRFTAHNSWGQISTNSLPNGFYIISVETTTGEQILEKIMVEHHPR
jgi:hypothetical protein